MLDFWGPGGFSRFRHSKSSTFLTNNATQSLPGIELEWMWIMSFQLHDAFNLSRSNLTWGRDQNVFGEWKKQNAAILDLECHVIGFKMEEQMCTMSVTRRTEQWVIYLPCRKVAVIPEPWNGAATGSVQRWMRTNYQLWHFTDEFTIWRLFTLHNDTPKNRNMLS